MATRIKNIALIGSSFLLMAGCSYDLDLGNAFGTSEAVEGRFAASMEWLAMNSLPEVDAGSDTYTFLVAGDSHLGGAENLSVMLDYSISSGATAVCVAGDLSSGREEDMLRADSLFNAYPGVTRFLIPGNHDLYFDGWEHYLRLYGPSVYTISIQAGTEQDLFLFLDSGTGTHGRSQLAWLKETLAAERELHRYAMIITHNNFFRNRFTGSTNPLNEEVLALLNIFTEHNVDLVIQGHDHKRYETTLGNTLYITMDALKDGDKNASYLELQLGPAGIETTFQDL